MEPLSGVGDTEIQVSSRLPLEAIILLTLGVAGALLISGWRKRGNTLGVLTSVAVDETTTVSSPHDVECHFCLSRSQVFATSQGADPGTKPGWYCHDCGQYNGFTEDGDYDREIREHHEEQTFPFGAPVRIPRPSSSEIVPSQPRLCPGCIRRCGVMSEALRQYRGEPSPEAYGRHAKRVKDTVGICLHCQGVVEEYFKELELCLKRMAFSQNAAASRAERAAALAVNSSDPFIEREAADAEADLQSHFTFTPPHLGGGSPLQRPSSLRTLVPNTVVSLVQGVPGTPLGTGILLPGAPVVVGRLKNLLGSLGRGIRTLAACLLLSVAAAFLLVGSSTGTSPIGAVVASTSSTAGAWLLELFPSLGLSVAAMAESVWGWGGWNVAVCGGEASSIFSSNSTLCGLLGVAITTGGFCSSIYAVVVAILVMWCGLLMAHRMVRSLWAAFSHSPFRPVASAALAAHDVGMAFISVGVAAEMVLELVSRVEAASSGCLWLGFLPGGTSLVLLLAAISRALLSTVVVGPYCFAIEYLASWGAAVKVAVFSRMAVALFLEKSISGSEGSGAPLAVHVLRVVEVTFLNLFVRAPNHSTLSRVLRSAHTIRSQGRDDLPISRTVPAFAPFTSVIGRGVVTSPSTTTHPPSTWGAGGFRSQGSNGGFKGQGGVPTTPTPSAFGGGFQTVRSPSSPSSFTASFPSAPSSTTTTPENTPLRFQRGIVQPATYHGPTTRSAGAPASASMGASGWCSSGAGRAQHLRTFAAPPPSSFTGPILAPAMAESTARAAVLGGNPMDHYENSMREVSSEPQRGGGGMDVEMDDDEPLLPQSRSFIPAILRNSSSIWHPRSVDPAIAPPQNSPKRKPPPAQVHAVPLPDDEQSQGITAEITGIHL